MSKEDNTKLFTMTVLLSSFLMLNIKFQIDERELESLELFVEYAKSVKEEGMTSRPFQILKFLVRDWQHDENYGSEGGEDYLDEVLTGVTKPELQVVRDNLRSSFENIGCFLMPDPGSKVKKANFSGLNKDIEQEFRDSTSELAVSILSPEQLREKIFEGNVLTGRTLWQLMGRCDEAFGSCSLPTVENMTTMTAKARNQRVSDEGIKMYKEYMTEHGLGNGVEDDVLERLHKNAQEMALTFFEQEAKFGSDFLRESYRKHLVEECQFEFDRESSWNDQRKLEAKIFSAEKIHELWTEYKENMKASLGEGHHSVKSLKDFHDKHKLDASKNYQIDAATRAAYVNDHLESLQSWIEESYQKFIRINEDWEKLEMLARIPDCQEKYEGFLFLHGLSQQYREEFEKFCAMYVEKEKLEEQNNKLREEYHKLFEDNWNPNGDHIEEYLARFIEILHEECDSAIRINERNKDVLQNKCDQKLAEAKMNYSEVMSEVVKDAYVKPGELKEISDEVKGKVIDTLKEEVCMLDNGMQLGVVDQAAWQLDRLFEQFQERNGLNLDFKPSLAIKEIRSGISAVIAGITAIGLAVRRFLPVISMIRSACTVVKPLLPSITLQASEGTALALATPAATAIGATAGALAIVAGVGVIAYCVYKYHTDKQKQD